MKITVNTFGSRGDVQPYIALALGLRQAGHAVRIVTHEIFQRFVEGYGFDFYPLQLDPRQVLINQSVSELGNNSRRIIRWMKENFKPVLRDIFEVTLAANHGTELMLNSSLSFAGWHVAEKLSIPALATLLWPMTPSRHLLGATGKIPRPWLPFRKVTNYYSTKLFNQLFYNMMLPLVNECRKEVLDLRPKKAREYWLLDSPRSSASIIYGYSPTVVPKPPDWNDKQQVSGYWFLDSGEDYEPEADLLAFLANGPPPVSIGFGSMVDHERDVVSHIVIDALRESGQRGILLGGWGEIGSGRLPDYVFRVDSIPHSWLFPRVAAAIHHGGAGTTAAAMRAGVPSVVVPWFGDQYFWGWRVQELSVGSKLIPRKKLTVARLTAAIQQVVSDEAIKLKSAQLGRQIYAEDGVGTAVRLIEAFARNGHF